MTAKYPKGNKPVTKSSFITVNEGSGSTGSPLSPLAPVGAIGIIAMVFLRTSGRKRH